MQIKYEQNKPHLAAEDDLDELIAALTCVSLNYNALRVRVAMGQNREQCQEVEDLVLQEVCKARAILQKTT